MLRMRQTRCTHKILTNYLKLSPTYEAGSRSAIQEFLNILWSSKVHHRVHRSPPLVPILSHQINPVHTTLSYFSKVHLNIIPHLRLGLPGGLYPSGFPIKILYELLLMRVTCPVHFILLDSYHSDYTWCSLCRLIRLLGSAARRHSSRCSSLAGSSDGKMNAQSA
jgi:hypothetical protein